MSRSAKLEYRHKLEVTLIDYLVLICIFQVIIDAGNRTNRQRGLNDVSDYALITSGGWETK